MKCLSVLALIAVPLAASAAIITSTTDYDDSTQSLELFECYDGYLSAHGYKTLRDLPTYPNVTASTLVQSSVSPYCGACFKFTFGGKTTYAVVVDSVITLGGSGTTEDVFITSRAVTNVLTNGQLGPEDSIEGLAVQVDSSYCKPV